MKSLAWVVFGFVLAQLGCAMMKPVIRTVADLASEACESLAGQSQDQLQGLSARDWCAIERNLQPFIDGLLAAEQKAGLRR